MSENKPIVTELMLPPGSDGKAHPDFKNNCGSFEWKPFGDRYKQWFFSWQSVCAANGTILPDAARSIAWLWGETLSATPKSPFDLLTLNFNAKMMRAWGEVARGNPDYIKLPIVEFKA